MLTVTKDVSNNTNNIYIQGYAPAVAIVKNNCDFVVTFIKFSQAIEPVNG